MLKAKLVFCVTLAVIKSLKALRFGMTFLKPMIKRCFLLPLLLLICSCVLAQTPTQVRYASLYRALEPGLIIAKFDRLVARQRIVSRQSGVSPNQIEVRILAASGVIIVKVAPDGSVNFPMTQALLAENPVVESNQAKGSLSLSATMEIKLGQNKVVAYSDIYESAMQAQQAVLALGSAMVGRKVRSIEFEFDRAKGARAELVDSKADELLMADKQGFVILRIDAALAKRKAQVTFSSLPIAARPHID